MPKTTDILTVGFAGKTEALSLAFPAEVLNALADRVRFTNLSCCEEEWREQKEALRETNLILSTWGMPALNAEFLKQAPSLIGVFYAAGSIKPFATPEAFLRGVRISSAQGANAIPVAEYASSAILLSLKQFWRHARAARERHAWHHLPVPGAHRSIVGLVSLGAVGRMTAQMLATHDLEVLAYDPFASQETASKLGVKLTSLEEVFYRSDVVSIHAPWLPETENMINGRLLRMMKSGATILNTSRGAVINEPELYDVLQERPDISAVLDVTHPEPPRPDSPLHELENVFLTPHISGSMGNEITRMGRWMVDEVVRFLNGDTLKHEVSENHLTAAA